jgi:hypothetical protein
LESSLNGCSFSIGCNIGFIHPATSSMRLALPSTSLHHSNPKVFIRGLEQARANDRPLSIAFASGDPKSLLRATPLLFRDVSESLPLANEGNPSFSADWRSPLEDFEVTRGLLSDVTDRLVQRHARRLI